MLEFSLRLCARVWARVLSWPRKAPASGESSQPEPAGDGRRTLRGIIFNLIPRSRWLLTPPPPPLLQHAVLSHRWEPTHGREWAAGMDEVLLPNLPVRAPNGAIGQDHSKGKVLLRSIVPPPDNTRRAVVWIRHMSTRRVSHTVVVDTINPSFPFCLHPLLLTA